ncbi:dihydrodipicolinate synthase family protein [Spongiactinospora sp. 9N601]|uniref:dihydrodipicolinate synthase family protein n=1 Tax=Spongiactinospora sp. 9N601 TaxID=3375149 RepID=UPI00378CE45E
MDRSAVDWHGYIPAVTTPFAEDGALDLAALAVQLEWMVDERLPGIVLAGTTGEWFSMTERERATLFEAAAKAIAGRITVIAGCTAYTADEAIRHAHAAERAGCDGILLTPPPYLVPGADEIVAFYQEVSAAIGLPICVYNWPRGTNVDMSADLLSRLAEVENVVAIKNSTGDFAAWIEGLYRLKDQVRYFGFPMNEVGITLLRHVGGDGTMGAGAVLGREHADFFRHVAAGDLDAARRCGERDRVLMERWFTRDLGPRFASAQAVLKAALRMRGVPAGHVRRPLLPLTSEQLDQVAATMDELGLRAA